MEKLVATSFLRRRLENAEDRLGENIEIFTPEKGTDDELTTLAKDVDVIVCARLSGETVKNAPKLKLIQKMGAGESGG